MNIRILLFCTLVFVAQDGKAQFGKLLDKAKSVLGVEDGDLDVAGGLKEALEVGVTDAVSSLATEDPDTPIAPISFPEEFVNGMPPANVIRPPFERSTP